LIDRSGKYKTALRRVNSRLDPLRAINPLTISERQPIMGALNLEKDRHHVPLAYLNTLFNYQRAMHAWIKTTAKRFSSTGNYTPKTKTKKKET